MKIFDVLVLPTGGMSPPITPEDCTLEDKEEKVELQPVLVLLLLLGLIPVPDEVEPAPPEPGV
jgi:hypothetical protein